MSRATLDTLLPLFYLNRTHKSDDAKRLQGDKANNTCSFRLSAEEEEVRIREQTAPSVHVVIRMAFEVFRTGKSTGAARTHRANQPVVCRAAATNRLPPAFTT